MQRVREISRVGRRGCGGCRGGTVIGEGLVRIVTPAFRYLVVHGVATTLFWITFATAIAVDVEGVIVVIMARGRGRVGMLEHGD